MVVSKPRRLLASRSGIGLRIRHENHIASALARRRRHELGMRCVTDDVDVPRGKLNGSRVPRW